MKKNVMTAIVSGAMVGCLAIGGTFAYLTANSGTVTNTFTGGAKLNVLIQETAKDGDTYDIKGADGKNAESATTDWLKDGEQGSIEYINVVPGAELDKHVKVKVEDNATPSYLFIKVVGETENADANIDADEWENVTPADAEAGTAYYVKKSADGSWTVFSRENQNMDTEVTVFTKVNIGTGLTAEELNDKEIGKIIVTGAIVQSEGATADAAKGAALTALGYTAPAAGADDAADQG